MEGPVTRPDTVNKLRFAADSAFAILAGMQLDVFTPLKGGPQTGRRYCSGDRCRSHTIAACFVFLSCCRIIGRGTRTFLEHSGS